MAKILISSLGTGQLQESEYRKTNYSFQGQNYETSFVAYALNKFHNFDKIYLIGTKRSIWDEAYRVFSNKVDDKIWEKLYENKENGTIIEDDLKIFKNMQIPIYAKIIDYGLNEDELWDNFERYIEIANDFNDEDEIYLDITHSFRSLALFSYVMTQFAQSISNKSIKIKSIFYGMLEYSYENNGITPIVDIKLLIDIQEWIKAIDAIKKYSDFNPLVTLLEEENIEKPVQNVFTNINNTINLANMTSMKTFISTANKKLNSIDNSSNKIIKLLTPEISKIINDLNHEKMSDFQFSLAKWFHKNHNYALSYMALAEAIVTKTCELKGYNETTEEDRKEAKKHIDTPWDKMYSATKKEHGKIVDNEGSISYIRNAIAHQLNKNIETKRDIAKLSYFLDEFEKYFNS